MFKIDVVSDVVCPWCYIGKRNLDTARAERPTMQFDVMYRPYQLNPDLPLEGEDRRAHLLAKFGSEERLTEVLKTVESAAESVGLKLRYDKIKVSPNTLNAHRLIRWAFGQKKGDSVVDRLFRAYFEEGADIGQVSVLAALGGECGLDEALVDELLSADHDREAVYQEANQARAMGISGVPTFILQNKWAIVGAQPAHVLTQAFDSVAAQAASA